MRGKLVIFAIWLAAFFQTSAFTPAPLNISLERPISGFGFVEAFPPLRFEQPVAVVSAPGETNRVFVVERRGLVWAVTNLANPSASVFLDLSWNTLWDIPYNEAGLLGVAFHPGFATNGYLYVYRTVYEWGDHLKDTLSRFQASPDRSVADATAEYVLFAQDDIAINHNAGTVRFGPDGYLYFSIGCDGPVNPNISGERQAIDNGMFGGIFRIDVDKRPGSLDPNPAPEVTPGAYKIPAANPWVGATTFLGKAVDPTKTRTEYFAVGLRNPWQFSLDPVNGEIYCGDVGEGGVEEVDLIEAGRNYGWPYFEGPYGQTTELPAVDFTPPVFSYEHGMSTNNGSAVIGGLVLHNQHYPGLDGAYIFGDFGSGNVRAFWREPYGVQWIAREPGIASFALDPSNGDLLIVNVGEGTIRRLVYVPPAESTAPQLLSQTGIFTNLQTLAIAPGYVPYDINVAFWSDGARKQRWFGMTDASARFGFVEDANWVLPKGAVWVKHFELEMVKGDASTAKRIETRVLIKDADDIYGYTYRWGNSTTDAELVAPEGMDESFQISDGGQIREQVWHYPGRGECHSCHSKNAGFAAGFNTFQLNHEATHDGVTKNELTRLAELGYLDREGIDPLRLHALARADDQTQPLEHRVKSFFAANCAICHHPGGLPIKARWDGRLTTPLESANIIGGPLSQPFRSWDLERVVQWRDVTNSVLVQRMLNFEAFTYHMPPFATTVVNDEAIQMLTQWINTLPTADWSHEQVGASPLFGSLAQTDNSLIVAGAGEGVAADHESEYFAHRPMTGNVELIGRIKNVPGSTAGLGAGLMIRAATETNAATAALLQDVSGKNRFVGRRDEQSAPVGTISGQAGKFNWQRLVRDGNRVSAWESADGQTWSFIGAVDATLPEITVAGLAVSSGDAWKFATAEFDNVGMMSVALDVGATKASLPQAISLAAQTSQNGETVDRVEFWASDRFIGSVQQAPWTLAWTNAVVGNYLMRAIAFDSRGLSVTSAPVAISLSAPPASAIFANSKTLDSPAWHDSFGSIGYVLPSVITNLPAGSNLKVDAPAVWFSRDSAPFGLDDLKDGVIASSWIALGEVSLRFAPGFEDPYLFTLYFADYTDERPELQVTLISGDTGEVLDQRVEKDFALGQGLTWSARGTIRVRITSLNSAKACVSGFFLDPLPPPHITLTSPFDGDDLTLPSPITLRAEATVQNRPLRSVNFYSDGALIASVTNPPYEFVWTNALAGNHTITAVAVGYFGRNTVSTPATIRCDLRQAAATFIGINGLTRGDWPKAYGADGFSIPLGSEQFRPWTRVTFNTVDGTHEWEPESSDPRALRQFTEDSRIAACWFSLAPLDATIEFLDGGEHTFALYFLDFERVGANQYLQLFDANSNALLDTQSLDDIGEGVYYSWIARGRVRVHIERRSVWSAVMSGIFIGGPISNSQAWWAEHFGDALATPQWNDDPDNDGRPNFVEYALGSNPFVANGPLSVRSTIEGRFLLTELDGSQVAADVRISLETSTDLTHWQPASSVRADGDQTIRFETDIIESAPHFYRLRFEPP